MKRTLAILLALAMLLSCLVACGNQSTESATGNNATGEQTAAFGDTLRVACATDISTLDPTNFTDLQTQLASTALYSRLVKFDKDLNIVFDVAEDYEVLSDLEWQFTLKQGVKFHDGSELKSADVAASIMRAKEQPLIAHIVEQIDSVECPDDYTVVIKTKVPFAPLLNNLADPACSILPKALIDAGNDFNAHPVGSGPYTFTEWQPGEKSVFTKFADYFDTENASQFEKLELLVVPEAASRSIMLETGEIEIATSLDVVDYSRVKDNADLGLYETTANQLYYLVFNQNKAPFDNQDFRKAIEYAVDKESVIAASQDGKGDLLLSALPKNVAGYIEYEYDYNPELAKEYLEKSGYVQGDEVFTIYTMSELLTKMAQVIQSNLADIGIKVEIEQNTVAAHMEMLGAGEFELGLSGWSTAPDPDRFLRPLFHMDSVGTNNFSQMKDEALSAEIDAAVGILDVAERTAAYEKINSELMDKAVIVPITGKLILVGYRAGLQNVYMDSIFGMDFNTIRY